MDVLNVGGDFTLVICVEIFEVLVSLRHTVTRSARIAKTVVIISLAGQEIPSRQKGRLKTPRGAMFFDDVFFGF